MWRRRLAFLLQASKADPHGPGLARPGCRQGWLRGDQLALGHWAGGLVGGLLLVLLAGLIAPDGLAHMTGG